jgi:hypothetical protein
MSKFPWDIRKEISKMVPPACVAKLDDLGGFDGLDDHVAEVCRSADEVQMSLPSRQSSSDVLPQRLLINDCHIGIHWISIWMS